MSWAERIEALRARKMAALWAELEADFNTPERRRAYLRAERLTQLLRATVRRAA